MRACLPVNQERREMNISKINFILLPLWPAALILTSVLNVVSDKSSLRGLRAATWGKSQLSGCVIAACACVIHIHNATASLQTRAACASPFGVPTPGGN